MDASDVIQYMDDPALVLDPEWRVRAANTAFGHLIDGDVAGATMAELFAADADLAAAHAETLTHYPDVAGVVDGTARHFDTGHDTIAALRDRRDPREDDPDMGVVVNGDRQYFDLTTVDIADSDAQLLVFRDITRVKDHEQDLDFLRQVMDRVLRHNLRNDMSVIRGQATAIAERSDDDRAEMARTIKEKSDALLETSEKTRLIQQAIESTERISHDLQSVVERGIDQARAHDATIETAVPEIGVRAIPQLRDALADTIENAAIYSKGGTVEIAASRQDGWATLTIADEGPGIPDHELAALEKRGETDLSHGSGAGLWLIYTTIHESDGEITFDTEDGTTVRIRLPLD